jgi:hypothetical protein
LAKELEHTLAEVLKVETAPRNFARCFRVSSEVPDGAATYEQKYEETFGKSQFITGKVGKDVPRVGVKRAAKNFPVRMMGIAIEYTLEELQHAAYANVPLDRSYQEAARLGDDLAHNDIAWKGESEVGLMGLFTVPAIQRTPVNSLAVTTANADAWVARLSDPIIKLIADTKGLVSSVRVVMSDRLMAKLTSVRNSTSSDRTIMEFWLAAMGARVESVIGVHEVENPNEDGKDYIAYYPPSVVEYVAPRLLTPLPPQMEGLNTVIYMTSKSGGLYVRRPAHCLLVELPTLAA